MKRYLGCIVALAVSACMILSGCATVDLSNKCVPEDLPSSEISSTTSSVVSSLPSSEASSQPSSAPSSVPSSAPSSVPASSKAQTPSRPAVSSAPPPVSSAPPPVSSAIPPSSTPPPPPVSSAPPASSTPPPPPAPVAPVTQDSMATIENDIVAMVNNLRTSLGLATYTTNNLLKASAYARSAEMYANNYFEHTRPDGRGFETAITEVGYNFTYVMENIGELEGYSASEYATVLFEAWKKSPGHYAAMTSPDCTEIGVALYASGSKVYATQHFGKQ